jgi:hypothetical protein
MSQVSRKEYSKLELRWLAEKKDPNSVILCFIAAMMFALLGFSSFRYLSGTAIVIGFPFYPSMELLIWKG